MEAAIVVMLAVLVVPLVGVIWWGVHLRGLLVSNLKAIAAQYGGVFHPGSAFTISAAEFEVDGVRSILWYAPNRKGTPAQTKMQFQIDLPGELHLAPEDTIEAVGKFLGGQDIQIGDPGFDAAWSVKGEPEGFVRQVLDPEARTMLYHLSQHAKEPLIDHGVTLEIGKSGVVILAYRRLGYDLNKLRPFIDMSVALFRRLRWLAGATQVVMPQPAAAGTCAACRHPLDPSAVACPRCQAPHHWPCMNYYGGCAVFGCGARLPGR